ncbi:hypothetical protein GCM10010412_089300 [Nonomuraea recticatena]|uniref:FAD-binding domain-containing protein n=1 Tax=Nonomuraea recticatena TaxID=46178 RepID=A0ABP6FM97_9ACTN
MTAVRTALVVGGGIAGPVTAMALRRAGIEATVFEAYASGAEGIGGTLTIAPNGLDALRAVGAEAAVRAVGQPVTRTVVSDGRGRRIGELDSLHQDPGARGHLGDAADDAAGGADLPQARADARPRAAPSPRLERRRGMRQGPTPAFTSRTGRRCRRRSRASPGCA